MNIQLTLNCASVEEAAQVLAKLGGTASAAIVTTGPQEAGKAPGKPTKAPAASSTAQAAGEASSAAKTTAATAASPAQTATTGPTYDDLRKVYLAVVPKAQAAGKVEGLTSLAGQVKPGAATFKDLTNDSAEVIAKAIEAINVFAAGLDASAAI